MTSPIHVEALVPSLRCYEEGVAPSVGSEITVEGGGGAGQSYHLPLCFLAGTKRAALLCHDAALPLGTAPSSVLLPCEVDCPGYLPQ